MTTDRYVIDRSSFDADLSKYLLRHTSPANSHHISYRQQKQQKMISFLLFGKDIENQKVLHQKRSSATLEEFIAKEGKIPRKVKPKPERILEAPNIVNDFYSFTIDWNSNNTLGVALETNVHCWNAGTNKTSLLAVYPSTMDGQYISCIAWEPHSAHLAITSTDPEYVDLWSSSMGVMKQSLKTRGNQVISMSYSNDMILSCGSVAGEILHYDRRTGNDPILKSDTNDVVCGLRWSPNGTYLASGSNNTVKIFDIRQLRKTFLVMKNIHTSAVKALAWCPWQPNMIASGGGIRDQTINIWNIMTAKIKQSVQTGAQITSVLWSERYKELLTTHGRRDYASMKIWDFPSMALIAGLTLHQERILHAVMSPNECSVAVASADETISIWNCFPDRRKKIGTILNSKDSLSYQMYNTIR